MALKEQGHDPGPADGIIGSSAQQALKSFQQSKGLQATGRLDGLQKDKDATGKGQAVSKEEPGSEAQSKRSGNQGQTQKGAGKEIEKGPSELGLKRQTSRFDRRGERASPLSPSGF